MRATRFLHLARGSRKARGQVRCRIQFLGGSYKEEVRDVESLACLLSLRSKFAMPAMKDSVHDIGSNDYTAGGWWSSRGINALSTIPSGACLTSLPESCSVHWPELCASRLRRLWVWLRGDSESETRRSERRARYGK